MNDHTSQPPLFTTSPNDPTQEIPYGYCHCGCGQLAPIAKETDKRTGWIKGQPKRFINGHYSRAMRRPPEERFWEKVDKRGPDDCWEWQAGRYPNGYGIFWSGMELTGAHRFSYSLVHGPIPDGMMVMHSCDNPCCVNPSHLSLGDNAANTKDKMAKGRANPPKGEEHCCAQFTNDQVREFRRQFAELNVSIRKFARMHNVHHRSMWALIRGITYKDA